MQVKHPKIFGEYSKLSKEQQQTTNRSVKHEFLPRVHSHRYLVPMVHATTVGVVIRRFWLDVPSGIESFAGQDHFNLRQFFVGAGWEGGAESVPWV